MKLAIVGYGKMGKLVEGYSRKRGHEISGIIDPSLGTTREDLLTRDFDVIIEFSVKEVARENLLFYASHNYKVIMATTGWYEYLDEIKQAFQKSKGAILWAGNFSLGVHIFWKIIETSAKIFNAFPEYDVFGHEFHHNKKADAPSGTAFTTGNILLSHIERKKKLVTQELAHRAIQEDELHFSSTRGGNIPGIHQVFFDSNFDTIKIEHSARSRDGFALGAVVCAEWLKDKKGYFEIEDFMNEML